MEMDKQKPTLLVVGGAGYIGSHIVLDLLEKERQVLVLDNFVYGHEDFVQDIPFIRGDLGDGALLDSIFTEYNITGVFHFAAFAYVGESVEKPAKYYHNNVVATLTLLDKMVEHKIPRFIFSSTCATYGVPDSVPIREEDPQAPINPYGRTKLMVEHILADYEKAYGLQSVIFRYFNAAGADPRGRRGERHDPETHLIPLVLAAAAGKRKNISVFGDDYNTPDGTCIRDYIHVNDLSQAHILGLEYLEEGRPSTVFNLGNGQGFSVLEIIAGCREITGRDIPVEMAPRRAGDPPALIGDAAKAREILGWRPRHASLEDILGTAWRWHQKDWQIS